MKKHPSAQDKDKPGPFITTEVNKPSFPFLCQARSRKITEPCTPNPEHPDCLKCSLFLYLLQQEAERSRSKAAVRPEPAKKHPIAPAKIEKRQAPKPKISIAPLPDLPPSKTDRGGAYQMDQLLAEDFDKLSNTIGRGGLEDRHKEALEMINRHYWAEREMFLNQERKVGAIKKLKRIIELAPMVQEWNRIFEDLDTSPLDELFNAGYRLSLGDGLTLGKALDKLTVKESYLDLAYRAAQEALNQTNEDPGGRPPELAIQNLVLRLAVFFEKITGEKTGLTKNPYQDGRFEGRFFRLVDTFLEMLDQWTRDGSIPRGNMAIGKHMERVLRIKTFK